MPQEKAPKRGPMYFGPLRNKDGSRSNYRQSVAKMGKDSQAFQGGKPGLTADVTEIFGEQAQAESKAQADFYKKNPAARKAKIASTAAAAKSNEAKNRKNAATNAAFAKRMRQVDARETNRQMQVDMNDAKLQQEDKSRIDREKSPASIQQGMAASTRKTQAASAAARKQSTSASPIRQLLKIK